MNDIPASEIEAPTPVSVSNPEPIPVTIEPHDGNGNGNGNGIKRTAAAAKVDADTLRTKDQRRISGIWERTQQLIALSVVWVALMVAAYQAMARATDDPTTAGVAFVFLASVSNLVIGFYFGRTNHSRVGGDATPTEAAQHR